MSSINWKVRIANKSFWVALIPALLVLIQMAAAIFGYKLDLGELGNNLLNFINALFMVLSILGIVNDPTTKGISDSDLAMTYTTPKER